MSTCRFLYNNFITGPEALGVSSARPGMVGSPAAEALGSATCLAAGKHTGDLDQVLVVEIDSLEAGTEVGLATFRWKRQSAEAWEASGVPTSVSLCPLADGASVKWVPGAGQEFYKGDRWSILATGRQGPQALTDRDRDTAWRSEGCARQWIAADQGQPQPVRALVLADHNLSETATALLKARDTLYEPMWSFDPDSGRLVDSAGNAGANDRATGRTYIDGGLLKYAEAGESCLEDGMLSIQPAATNLMTHSQEFDDPAWTVDEGGLALEPATAPDGAESAAKLVESEVGSNTAPYLRRDISGLADGTLYTLSVFAKAGERTFLRLRLRGKDEVYSRTWFDLEAGAVGTADPALTGFGMEAVGGGWHRCWVAQNLGTGGTVPRMVLGMAPADGVNGYATDGVSELYLWGAQLEAGPAPTAYIPTADATASRAADAVSFPLPEAVQAAMSEGGQGCLALEWTPGLGHGDFPLETVQALVSTSGESGYTFLPLYLYNAGEGPRVSAYGLSRLHRADASVDFAGGQSYSLAMRWQSGGDFQVGVGADWGPAKTYEGSFNLEAGRLGLGMDPLFPMRLGPVKIWQQHLEEEPRHLAAPWGNPAYVQALSITRPHLVCFLDQTFRYWRLELDDPGNPEGMLRASLLYLGDYFEPRRTFRSGYSQGSVATRKLVTGSGGKVAGSAGTLAAYYQLEFPRLNRADADSLEEMLAAVHSGGEGGLRPLFFTPFGDDPDQTLYCLPGAELSRQQAPGGRWNLGLRLDEVVKSDV